MDDIQIYNLLLSNDKEIAKVLKILVEKVNQNTDDIKKLKRRRNGK
jgi:hypothetical protein